MPVGRSRHWLAAAFGIVLTMGCSGDDSPADDNDDNTPVNSPGTVEVSGEPFVGATLTATISDSNGVGGPVTYQWLAGGAEVSGASGPTYVPTSDDVGLTVSVRAEYTDDDGFDETVEADPTSVIRSMENVAGTVSIFGVPAVGRSLTAEVEDENGIGSSTFSFQWRADDQDIVGATAGELVLSLENVGQLITVQVAYTDDDGNEESIVSAALGPVTEDATNVEGSVSIAGTSLVGETLEANVVDANGVSGTIEYQWLADGAPIDGATAANYAPTVDERGAVMGVTVSYVDDDGFDEGPLEAAAADVVFSAIATGEASLAAAAAAALDGDVIGLATAAGGDDYTDMAEIEFAANGVLIKRTVDSDAVIRGATCLVFGGEGTVVDGLIFEGLDWLGGGLCDANGDASIFVRSTAGALRNCEFRSEASPRTVAADDPYHYLALKGVGNVVERNLFRGKDMDNEGAAITLFANTDAMSNQEHVIQYNLFESMLGKSGDPAARNSSAYAIQVGRTTGADSQGDGLFIIQYNRFDSIESEQRLMRVQSSANQILGNTIVDSLGMISLEDGFGNTVTRNVILSSGEDNDDGGIAFAPLGHAVTDNYINNLRTTSSQRGGLLVNTKPLTGAGNTAILATPGLDLTVEVSRNTVVNARRAVLFEDASCAVFPPLLDFDDNLVMNQSSAESINANTNGVDRDAVSDGDFAAASCALAPASTFDGNHFHSARLSESGAFDFNGGAGANVVGTEDGATFEVGADGLVLGTGADQGVGVDTSLLQVIEAAQVGPGSTWTAP